jgi:hypothetical protein
MGQFWLQKRWDRLFWQGRICRSNLFTSRLSSCLKRAQDLKDQHVAVDDSDLESRDDTRNLTAGLATVARQSDESAFDISLDICAAVSNVDLEIDSSSSVVHGGEPKEDSHTTDKLQTCTSDESTVITAVAS